MQCLPIVAPRKQRRKIRVGGLVSHIGDTNHESRRCPLHCRAKKPPPLALKRLAAL
jgi:hypothetical protein